MKHVVSFSGGRTSAYLVHLIEQKRKKEEWDVEYVFMDTGAEHPKTYEFIKNTVKYFSINLTVLKPVFNQTVGIGVSYEICEIDQIGWDLSNWSKMMKKHGNPYVMGAFCTSKLKTEPYDKYCNEKYGKGNYITWLGIRIDEKRRLKARQGVRYLAEISNMRKHEIIHWFKSQPFDLDLDEWLGNCVFCLKKGINKVALAAIQEPELAKEWSQVTTSIDNRQSIKKDGTKIERGAIYRGKLTLEGVAKFYEGKSAEDIASTMRLRRECGVANGESCEVFGCQGDLFEDESK